MKTLTLALFAIATLSACEQYKPSEANCFNFVARGPADKDCTFSPLMSGDHMEVVAH